MAKVVAPLLSMEARGTIGKAITFAAWKGIAYARRWFAPAQPRTAAQVTVRNRVVAANLGWQILTAPQKVEWDVYATAQGLPMSGWNWYCKRFVLYMRDNAEAEPLAPFLPPAP